MSSGGSLCPRFVLHWHVFLNGFQLMNVINLNQQEKQTLQNCCREPERSKCLNLCFGFPISTRHTGINCIYLPCWKCWAVASLAQKWGKDADRHWRCVGGIRWLLVYCFRVTGKTKFEIEWKITSSRGPILAHPLAPVGCNLYISCWGTVSEDTLCRLLAVENKLCWHNVMHNAPLKVNFKLPGDWVPRQSHVLCLKFEISPFFPLWFIPSERNSWRGLVFSYRFIPLNWSFRANTGLK